MASTAKLGILSKLYYNSGSYGSPVWVVIPKVGDMTIPYEWDVAKAATRDSRVELGAKTILKIGAKFKLRKDPTDTTYLVVDNAAVDDTILDILVLDGASNSNTVRGFRFDAQVASAGETQNPGDLIHVDFDLIPAITANYPQRAVVTAGSPVFTAL